MISALSELDSVVRCIELGAEDYLPKPFNAVLLNARIGASLERKRLHDRERAHLAEIERQRRRADELLHAMLPPPAVRRAQDQRSDRAAAASTTSPSCSATWSASPATAIATRPRRWSPISITWRAPSRRSPARTAWRRSRRSATPSWRPPTCSSPHADPVMASLRAAFALADAAGSTPAGWQVRSGIHIGPVVAGVVGSRKFSFDLWGDTVNLAHRLSSLGDEPAIHLSATAWARVAGRVRGNSLGEIDRQGQGKRRGRPLPLDRELRGRRGASRPRDGASPRPASRYHGLLDLTAAEERLMPEIARFLALPAAPGPDGGGAGAVRRAGPDAAAGEPGPLAGRRSCSSSTRGPRSRRAASASMPGSRRAMPARRWS